MLSRRSMLKWSVASAAAVGLRPFLRPSTVSAANPGTKPRFYLQLIPSGGIDAVYCTDPRTAKDVEKGIDVPYRAKEIVETKHTRLGPAFASLAKHIDRIATINGVRQNSANHHAGLLHAACMTSKASSGTPTLLELLGARRPDGATGAVSIGFAYPTAFSPKFLGEPAAEHFGPDPGVFERLDKLDPDDLRVAARALRREAASLRGTEPAESATAENLGESAALFEAWASSPRFAPADWSLPLEGGMGAATAVQRALWMFENRLTRCATVMFGMYDSHLRNHYHQSRKIPYLAGLINAILRELDKRVFDGRPMSEQTVVIVGSEIGRFPRLNTIGGKDHFAQAPWLLIGPWFNTGATFGNTDRQLISTRVSLTSGKADKTGHLLSNDDLGTTLLTLDGANPELFGYVGQRLDFLLR